jgi:hypothetical protein
MIIDKLATETAFELIDCLLYEKLGAFKNWFDVEFNRAPFQRY